ncbi:MAG: hypothetical protein Kow00122_17430 [Thermoleophilia bacterium]
MNLNPTLIQDAEERFGIPDVLPLEAELDERDMELVAGSMRRLRVHDVTLFIVDRGEIAVIRKPMFPPGAYRAPSGGIHAGETLEEGAQREGLEETGLALSLERYVLRIPARFRPRGPWAGAAGLPTAVADPDEPSHLRWWTHVFLACVRGERRLSPRDTREIAEARWVTVEELQGPIRATLLATGGGLFRYRVALTDATLTRLGLWGATAGE